MNEPLTREQVVDYAACVRGHIPTVSMHFINAIVDTDATLRAKLAACEQERDALRQAGQP